MRGFNRLIGIVVASATLASCTSPQKSAVGAPQEPTAAKKVDRDFVIAVGMTEAEADCWELAAKTAGAFFALPELHSMDKQEIASAIHIVQNKLLSRPTYRKYLELAKAAHEHKSP